MLEMKPVVDYGKSKSHSDARAEGGKNNGLVAASSVAVAHAVSLKNALSDMQKIAGFMVTPSGASRSQAGHPQLAAPKKVTGAESEVLPLNTIMASLQEAIETNSVEQIQSRIATMNQAIEAEEANIEQRWQTFDGEFNNVVSVRSELADAVTTLANLKSTANALPQEVELAEAGALTAYDKTIATMTRLDESMVALQSLESSVQFKNVEKVQSEVELLDQILLTLQKCMLESKVNALSHQNKLYQDIQKSVNNQLEVSVNKHKEAQEKSRFTNNFLKFFLLGLTALLTIPAIVQSIVTGSTGVVVAAVIGVVSAILGMVDACVGGVMAQAILEPVMKGLADMIGKIVKDVYEAEISKGKSPQLAMAAAASAATSAALLIAVAVVVAAYLGGSAVTAAASKIGAELSKTGFGRAAIGLADSIVKSGAGVAITGARDVAVKFLGGKDGILKLVQVAQSATALLGTLTEGGLGVAAACIEKQVTEMRGEITLANNQHKNTVEQIEKFNQSFSETIPLQNKFFELASALIEAERDAFKSMRI